MEVEIIRNKDELDQVKPFFIEHLLWGTESIPRTYGYIGFVPEEGFYIKMICEEKDPLRVYEKDKDPVYRDSAVEAFLMFESEKERGGAAPYLNLEMNANGALLAAYGRGRTYRTYFPDADYEAFGCKAEIEKDRWSVSVKVPLSVLAEVYGPLQIDEGSQFACNFYKISEHEKYEHYAAYAPINTETPDFHCPEYFATAILRRVD